MRTAFSKPTAPDQFDLLLNSFRTSGYDALQLKTGQFLPWLQTPEEFTKITAGQPGAAGVLVYYDDLDDDRLANVIDFAIHVGSEMVVFCHNRSREGVTSAMRVAIAKQLAEHGKRARDAGIGLSLHHHFDHPVMVPSDVREFWGAIESGVVGLTVDTGHLAKSGVNDIPAFIEEFAPIIDNIHLKDFGDDKWRLLGEGTLDLAAILSTLSNVGYDGWLCVDEESDASLTDGLTKSRAWLDTHLRR